jgi:hypothetical protein
MSPRLTAEQLRRLLRPAIGFNRPADVVKDPDLSISEKRAILSSWASDSCAVEGKPYLRWMVGSDDPVPLSEVLEARARLDRVAAEAAGKARRRSRPDQSGFDVRQNDGKSALVAATISEAARRSA